MNRKWTAWFSLPKIADTDIKLAVGDELRLKYRGELARPWDAVGHVTKIPGSYSDEIALEMRPAKINTNCSDMCVEFVWNSTSFDRMQSALKTFAVDENSVSTYIYHRLLGHEVESQPLKVNMPKKYAL